MKPEAFAGTRYAPTWSRWKKNWTIVANITTFTKQKNPRLEIPADRLGRPEEVAKLILQTANAPEYMTGQIITIDGGWY